MSGLLFFHQLLHYISNSTSIFLQIGTYFLLILISNVLNLFIQANNKKSLLFDLAHPHYDVRDKPLLQCGIMVAFWILPDLAMFPAGSKKVIDQFIDYCLADMNQSMIYLRWAVSSPLNPQCVLISMLIKRSSDNTQSLNTLHTYTHTHIEA